MITDIDDKMIAKIKWPLFNPSTFVKKESKLNSDWSEKFIKVRRFYGKHYCHAVLVLLCKLVLVLFYIIH